jgi:hypothetical protein
MIELLSDDEVITYDGNKQEGINFAVSYEVMGLHHELMGYIASKKANTALHLADVAQRFDFANPVRLRDRRLVPMAQLGMWRCQADRTGHSISLGLLALMFHQNAFVPIKKRFDPKLGEFVFPK